MNHLAHFHLAWPGEGLVAGALEGDFHRGLLPGCLPRELVDGVALHRAIDGFTDGHQMLAGIRSRFGANHRRYAGILLDLSFDHFLSLHWSRFSDIDLDAFATQVYSILRRNTHLLSDKAQRAAEWLEGYNVLCRYQHPQAIHRAAARVGERLRGDNPLGHSEEILTPLLPDIEQAFLSFYPALIRFSANNDKLAPPGNETS